MRARRAERNVPCLENGISDEILAEQHVAAFKPQAFDALTYYGEEHVF